MNLFIPVTARLWWAQSKKPGGPGYVGSKEDAETGAGYMLGVVQQAEGDSPGACPTLLGNSEVGTPSVPTGQIC